MRNCEFIVCERYEEDMKKLVWSVMRLDGKTFDDGIVSYNFLYNEAGARAAIDYKNKLQEKYKY